MIGIGDYWGTKYEYARYYLPFVVKTGIKFSDWKQAKEMLMVHPYENYPGFLPKKAGLMLDIGSQYADWAIIAAKKYGTHVIAFEASRENADKAQANIDLNRLNKRIQLINLAVGSRNEIIEANYDGGMVNSIGRGEKEILETIRIDDLVVPDNLDLVKIDIEGFELEALKGMELTLLRYKPRVVIETHSWKLFEECGNLLYGLGYEMKERNPGRKGNGSFDWVQESFWMVKE